jgi:ParB family transcriptional regulator, chromosome partitioning protein
MATRINRYLDSVSAFDNIEIDLIHFPPNPLRYAKCDISDILESIRDRGLLQPIIVRPRGDSFEVVAGNRRLEACKRLKHRKIKAMVIELDDKSAYETAITENVQRRTLDPLEEARAFKNYCDKYGWGSQSELAKKIGKSQEYISHRIKHLELPEEVRSALMEKQISLASAEEMIWLKKDSAKKKLLSVFSKEKLSMHEVRHIVKAVNSSGTEDLLEYGIPDFPMANNEESEREKEFSHGISESILILRIALVRLDDLIANSKDPHLHQLLVAKRIAVHDLVDDLMATKKRGISIPQLISRRK